MEENDKTGGDPGAYEKRDRKSTSKTKIFKVGTCKNFREIEKILIH